MKKSTYIVTILIFIIGNLIVCNLVIKHGGQNSFHPVDISLIKKYFPFVLILLFPLLALFWTPYAAFRGERLKSNRKNNTTFNNRFASRFLQILLSINLLVMCWMLITGFL